MNLWDPTKWRSRKYESLKKLKILIFQVTLLETVFLCRKLSSDSWQKNEVAGMMNLALQSL